MNEPSNVKIPVRKPATAKKPAPKNLFQHISDGMGLHLEKQTKKTVDWMTFIKNLILSLATYLAIGYIVGMIADIFLKTGYLSQLFALLMLLFWILKKGKPYITERKK
jgi:hypothetical protein